MEEEAEYSATGKEEQIQNWQCMETERKKASSPLCQQCDMAIKHSDWNLR
jgi:hypothetical protein